MPEIAVIGLGYVGLPLALALARHGPTTGYDRDPSRIAELQEGRDRTGEVGAEELSRSALALTGDPARLAGHEIFIITVPTPIDGRTGPTSRPCARPAGRSAGRSAGRDRGAREHRLSRA